MVATRLKVRSFLVLLALIYAAPCFLTAQRLDADATRVQNLTEAIPPRPTSARTGSEFAAAILGMDRDQREQSIKDELLRGNLPDFLRKLVPVRLSYEVSGGRFLVATIFAAPDYLAIGSNEDFLRIPMNFFTAETVAKQFGFILPTKKIVDAIYSQAAYHLAPQPMKACPEMRSTEYYRAHNLMVEQQFHALGIPLGELISGDKKDLVVTNLLSSNPGKIAIYGWHRSDGKPIQPLSTVHGAFYADYSHGTRLISDTVLIDGKWWSIYNVLRDPLLAKILSYEGPIPNPWGTSSVPDPEMDAVLSK